MKTMKAHLPSLSAMLLLSMATTVQAHTGAGAAQGFIDGVTHPLLGIDHLLVMLAVGLWAAMRGGHALWLLPAGFLLAMAGGAGLHFAGIELLAAETWVAWSVMICGGLVARNIPVSTGLASALVAAFALGHGYVHAAELAHDANAAAYAIGFLLATAALHIAGVAAGLAGLSGKRARAGFGLLCATVGTTLLVGGL